jgi:hypothetical protein
MILAGVKIHSIFLNHTNYLLFTGADFDDGPRREGAAVRFNRNNKILKEELKWESWKVKLQL